MSRCNTSILQNRSSRLRRPSHHRARARNNSISFLKLSETLSVLVCAPPGTGKTVGVVVPTIFECDTVSMIVNDPKPELCYITSGYRAQVGPVFIINWGKEDDPINNVY